MSSPSLKLTVGYVVLGLLILLSGFACVFFAVVHLPLQLAVTGSVFLLSVFLLFLLVGCFGRHEPVYLSLAQPSV